MIDDYDRRRGLDRAKALTLLGVMFLVFGFWALAGYFIYAALHFIAKYW